MRLTRYLLFALLFAAASLSVSQTIPRTEANTLTGAHLVLPDAGSAKPLLLLLSFSHKASDDLTLWNRRFQAAYATDARIQYYELADFQGVPPLMMRMILHGMRRSVREPERSRVVLMESQEDVWKKLVSFGDPTIVYVVLADARGHVVWQCRGPASDEKARELEADIVRMTAQ